MTQRPVIVTGMHRSGTSAVARVVNLLGVDLGPEEDLMEAKPDNPEGFWENRRIVQIDDDLLAVLGGRWDEPPPLMRWREADRAAELRERAAEVLARIDGERPGFKDPRAALLLDFWTSLWPEAQAVVAVRHPAAVAASLEKRDGFDPEKSAELWLRYTAEALASAAAPVVVVFEELLKSPSTVVASLAADLDLSPSEERIAAAVASIRQGLPSSPADPGDRAGPRMEAAVKMYSLIGEIGPHLAALIAAGAGRDRIETQLVDSLERIAELVRVNDELRAELKKAQGDWAAAKAEAERLLKELKKTQGDWAVARAEADSRLEALTREERAREAIAERLAELEAELESRRRVSARLFNLFSGDR